MNKQIDCFYCGDPLYEGVACTRCEVPQHNDCWEKSGKCGTYACDMPDTRPYNINDRETSIVAITPDTKLSPLEQTIQEINVHQEGMPDCGRLLYLTGKLMLLQLADAVSTLYNALAPRAHKLGLELGLSSYTLDDILDVAQGQEVTVTAKLMFSMHSRSSHRAAYQPIAIVGDKKILIGRSIDVDFNPVEGVPGPMDLRHRIIRGRQREVESTCHNYVAALCKLGAKADYKDFDRRY